MTLKEIHLNEVKKMLRRIRENEERRPETIYLNPSDVPGFTLDEVTCLREAKEDVALERVLFGYFIMDDVYDYLEKVSGLLVLSRRRHDEEIKVVLDAGDVSAIDPDMDFFAFKRFCWQKEIEGLFNR